MVPWEPRASHYLLLVIPRDRELGGVVALISDLVPFVVSVWALMINLVLGSPGERVAWLSWFLL